MCGVIGIIGSDNASFDVYNGLCMLQHRGQDSAGILSFDGDQLHVRKKIGLVNQRFDKEDLGYLKGNICIGQVRYPTVGGDPKIDAQPFYTSHPYGIGMAHNGNIVNYKELKKEVQENDLRHVFSGCDIEVIMHAFAAELSKINLQKPSKDQALEALKRTMERLNGGYVIVTAIANKGLLAFRDPHGIRPLMFGKRIDARGKLSYAFASESASLEVLGFTGLEPLKPGEAIFIDTELNVRRQIVLQKKTAHCMFEWVYFARPDALIENKSVYEARLNLGRELAKVWKAKNLKADIVVPVPDSSRTSAMAFAEETGIPYREGLVKNRYVGRTFIMPTQSAREMAVKSKLTPVVSELKGKRVALIDDSIVRGTTSKQIVNMVKKAGAIDVHFLSTCPKIINPCFYGIDMSRKNELIAANLKEDEIKDYINAESLTYLSIEGLTRGLGFSKNELCTACLDGDYPTQISTIQISDYADMRTGQHTSDHLASSQEVESP